MNLQSPLAVGSLIRGQYAVVDLLGKGTFSAVYLVRDERNYQNRFVIKEVMHAVRKERHGFPFDAAMLRQLKHSALPRIYQVFHSDKHDRAYILMDYIEGCNLEVVQQELPEKRLSLPQAITLISPIMDAVSYLHRQQPPLIHGDIKPPNIIVPKGPPLPVLVDFCGVKELDSDTTTTPHQGTLNYRAPEQFSEGGSLRSDIYALGAILYTLLTGSTPAAAPDRLTRPGEKESDPLLPVNQIAPSVPGIVAEAIHCAMSIDSHDRFSTVDQFWEALWQVIHISPSATHVPELAVALPTEENTELDEDPTEPRLPIPVITPPIEKNRELVVDPMVPQITESGVEVPFQGHSPVHRTKKPGLSLLMFLCLALLVSIGLGSGLWLYIAPNQLPTTGIPASTGQFKAAPPSQITATLVPVSTPYPNVARPYNGTIYNILDNLTTKMSLTGMRQSQGIMSGYFTGLHMNSPLRGTINDSSHFEFTVTDSAAHITVSFDGAMQSDGNLSGNFCNLNREGQCAGEYGLWSVAPVE